MKLASPALALTIALAALPLAGCAVDAADDEIEIDLDAEEPTLDPESWTIDTVASSPEWDSGEIQIDPKELSDAKWFSADALPMIPPPLSIARQLIDAWVTEVTGKAPGA